MPAFLATIEAKLIALSVVVVLIGGAITYIYNKGENAGSSDVKAKVATETVRSQDAARVTKEKTNDTVRNTPVDILVDGMK